MIFLAFIFHIFFHSTFYNDTCKNIWYLFQIIHIIQIFYSCVILRHLPQLAYKVIDESQYQQHFTEVSFFMLLLYIYPNMFNILFLSIHLFLFSQKRSHNLHNPYFSNSVTLTYLNLLENSDLDFFWDILGMLNRNNIPVLFQILFSLQISNPV